MNRTFRALKSAVRDRFRSAKYAVHCFFKPYNVVKVHDLHRGWVDRDVLMYHVIFQILVDFVELEQPFVGCDEPKVKRFTDRAKMRAYIERWFNSPEAYSEDFDEMPEEEKQRERKSVGRAYKKNMEILYIYEWYKDRKYNFDVMKYYDMTGEEHVFEDHQIKTVPTGKEKLITWQEYHDIQSEHQTVCDVMLRRVLAVRDYLWT